MIAAILIILVILAVAGVVAAGRSMRVVQQFEQGIVYRFGKIQSPPRGAGLTVIRPVGDRMQKVNMQIVALAVPAQDGITKDNVTVRVDAVVYFRVVDPIKATVNVQNYLFAVSQQAQTSLGRSSASPRWTSYCRSGTRSTASCAGSSTSRQRARGASGSSGWRSRTSRCPRA
jgi:regulator of protease activity HflC (stomatin/prohibitin superfamily)